MQKFTGFGIRNRFNSIVHNGETLRHLLKFMTVGLMGTLLDLLVFAILRVRLGIPALLANTIAYGSGTVNNFFLHRHWTFAGWPVKAFGAQFTQFAVVGMVAIVINNLLLLLLQPTFDQMFTESEIGDTAAKVAAMVVSMCITFLVNHLWTFRKAPAVAKVAVKQV
jgi:putative flippase GtrA